MEAVYADENVWLTQKMMGQLYDVETHTINYHLKKVFSDSELEEDSVIRNFRITAADGKSYNLANPRKEVPLKASSAILFNVRTRVRLRNTNRTDDDPGGGGRRRDEADLLRFTPFWD